MTSLVLALRAEMTQTVAHRWPLTSGPPPQLPPESIPRRRYRRKLFNTLYSSRPQRSTPNSISHTAMIALGVTRKLGGGKTGKTYVIELSTVPEHEAHI